MVFKLKKTTIFITSTAILIAISILIPATVPAIHFTPLLTMIVAVHVPILIACFISPYMAIAVAIGSTFAFFFTQPLIVTSRASTHIIFAVLASLYFKKYGVPKNKLHLSIISIVIGIIHGLSEALVMHIFFFPQIENPIFSIYLVLGTWMLLYTCIDFTIAYIIYDRIEKIIKNPRYFAFATMYLGNEWGIIRNTAELREIKPEKIKK